MDPLVEYETSPDAVIVDAGDAVVEPAAPAIPADPAPEPVAADPLAGLDIEELRMLTELAPVLRQALEQPAPAPAADPGDGPPTYDPFDPASVAAYNKWNNDQLLAQIDQRLQPLVGAHQQEAEQRQQDLLKDAAHDIEVKNGEFVNDSSRSQMLDQARQIFAELSPRYGATDRTAELALQRAYEKVSTYEKQIGEAYYERKTNELKTLAGARTEPAVRGGAPDAPGEYKDEMEALAGFLAKQSPSAV